MVKTHGYLQDLAADKKVERYVTLYLVSGHTVEGVLDVVEDDGYIQLALKTEGQTTEPHSFYTQISQVVGYSVDKSL